MSTELDRQMAEAADVGKLLTVRFAALGSAARELAVLIESSRAAKKFTPEQAAQLSSQVSEFAARLASRVSTWADLQDDGIAKQGIAASFIELTNIGSFFTQITGEPNPVTKYKDILLPSAAFPWWLKWGLILGGSALAFKYLWSRAAPEYPRAQLPRYAGGRRGE